MEQKYRLEGLDEKGLVYVKSISVNDLPPDLQEDVAEEQEPLFAVHNSIGDRLAIVSGRVDALVIAPPSKSRTVDAIAVVSSVAQERSQNGG